MTRRKTWHILSGSSAEKQMGEECRMPESRFRRNEGDTGILPVKGKGGRAPGGHRLEARVTLDGCGDPSSGRGPTSPAWAAA